MVYETKAGETVRLDCEDVVFAGGREGELDSAVALASAVPVSHIVGDARKPASIAEAAYAAYTAAMQL